MTTHTANKLNLVADIGGTNTRVALAEGTELLMGSAAKYSNHKHSDLNSVLRQYIHEQGDIDCAGACIAVAGPVRDGVGRLTNLDWSMDRHVLAKATGAENIAILNDLQAQGHGLAGLPATSLRPILSASEPNPNAARLVIGLGTGFNAAIVYDTTQELLVPPAEAGHAGLPVETAEDLEFADDIRARHEFCAIDDVLTGRGIERLYRWHGRNVTGAPELAAQEIMHGLGKGTDPVADAALRHFVRLTGIAVGNLALTYLPFGGIYLAGGVARSVSTYFDAFGFGQAFHQKGRFSDFMSNFSVSVIEDDTAALTGCASYLHRQF